MKQIILLSLTCCLCLGYMACGEGSSAEKPATAITGDPEKDKDVGKFRPANAPGLTEPVLMLIDQYWQIDAFIDMKDKSQEANNVGRWYNFKKDGTFESKGGSSPPANGTWTFDENSKVLNIDSSVDAQDAEYTCRLSGSGNTLIFIGTKTYDQTHIQGKMLKVENPQG